MGRPAPHDEPRPGVQQHDEAGGEAGHDAAAARTHGQAADEPRAHATGQAELVLQDRQSSWGMKLRGAAI